MARAGTCGVGAVRMAAAACAVVVAACALDLEGRPCDDEDDCLSAWSCVADVCVRDDDADDEPTACAVDADCPAGSDCDGDACAPRAGDDVRRFVGEEEAPARVRVQNPGGTTRVVGVLDGTTVEVAVVIAVPAGVAARVDEIVVSASGDATSFDVQVQVPAEAAFADARVDVDVRAPRHVAFEEWGSAGAITLEGLRGGVTIARQAGVDADEDVVGRALAGLTTITTNAGNIDVQLEVTANVALTAYAADVAVRIPASTTAIVGATTTGGTVDVDGLSVLGETSTTDVNGVIGNPAAAVLQLTIAAGGDITLVGE